MWACAARSESDPIKSHHITSHLIRGMKAKQRIESPRGDPRSRVQDRSKKKRGKVGLDAN